MLTIRRILFPTDFSEGAARAFPQAVFLAKQHDAELHIVHVQNDGGDTQSMPVPTETLTDWMGGARENGVDLEALSIVQKQIEGSSASDQLVAYVEEEDVDLVVMGTHGRRGIQRMLLGSVTEAVVRTAPCPVLTVRTDADEAPGQAIRRILVPVDFSDASEQAVRHAAEIARTYGATLDLLHVIENVAYPSAYGVEPAFQPTQETLAQVESSLGGMARDLVGGENVSVFATIGYAPLTILDRVEKNDIDLIVIATHGRSGLDRVLLGSVAERVIRRSSVPVFVVKPDQRTLLPSGSVEATDEA